MRSYRALGIMIPCFVLLSCAIPAHRVRETELSRSQTKRSGGPVIVERDDQFVLHDTFSPVGPHDSTYARAFTYFFKYPDGKLREIPFLKSHEAGYGLEVHAVEGQNCWLAIDFPSADRGSAKIILFDEQGKLDECSFHFDLHDPNGAESWIHLSADNREISYFSNALPRQLIIDHGRLKFPEHSNAPLPTTTSVTPRGPSL